MDIFLNRQMQYVGKLKARHEAGKYVSPINNEPVMVPVLEFEDGNAFVESPSFERVLPGQVHFIEATQQVLRSTIAKGLKLMKSQGVDYDFAQSLFHTGFMAVMRDLESIYKECDK